MLAIVIAVYVTGMITVPVTYYVADESRLYRQWELGRPVEQVETHIRTKRSLGEQP
jgi:hypothetical protein